MLKVIFPTLCCRTRIHLLIWTSYRLKDGNLHSSTPLNKIKTTKSVHWPTNRTIILYFICFVYSDNIYIVPLSISILSLLQCNSLYWRVLTSSQETKTINQTSHITQVTSSAYFDKFHTHHSNITSSYWGDEGMIRRENQVWGYYLPCLNRKTRLYPLRLQLPGLPNVCNMDKINDDEDIFKRKVVRLQLYILLIVFFPTVVCGIFYFIATTN